MVGELEKNSQSDSVCMSFMEMVIQRGLMQSCDFSQMIACCEIHFVILQTATYTE